MAKIKEISPRPNTPKDKGNTRFIISVVSTIPTGINAWKAYEIPTATTIKPQMENTVRKAVPTER